MKNLQKTIASMSLGKQYLMAAFMFLAVHSMFAGAGANEIETSLLAWGTTIQTVVWVLTAIFAIVGGFLIFFQYMQGNDQAQKNFIKFIIGLAIMGLVNVLVNLFLPQAHSLEP